LLAALACCVHWLELAQTASNRRICRTNRSPAVLIAFLIATAAWIAALMFAFRRPAGE